VADYLEDPTNRLSEINPDSGLFPHGTWLNNVILTHRDNSRESLQGIIASLRAIGNRLIEIASNYTTTEELNRVTSEAIDDLETVVDGNLPEDPDDRGTSS